jgi:hypothetical protein
VSTFYLTGEGQFAVWHKLADGGGEHVVMISHPTEVADVVMTAASTCATQPA